MGIPSNPVALLTGEVLITFRTVEAELLELLRERGRDGNRETGKGGNGKRTYVRPKLKVIGHFS